MKIPCYHVDAFAGEIFRGNPAAVCPLDAWLPDATMQNIAAENNLAETAFVVPRGNEFELRWFTPTIEVDLCGHATLAAAFVLFAERNFPGSAIRFHSRSGVLNVTRGGEILTLDFPARPPQPCAMPEALVHGLGSRPAGVLKSRDFFAVFDSADAVRALRPDFAALKTLDCLGIIATAPGDDCDFVSRFFAPGAGIDEDPATGSSHCTLIPYWAQRLGKTKLFARQASQRGGEMFCELVGDRVFIGGKAAPYLRGKIVLDDSATIHKR
jgi:PhzF family phenazine biosynthesis protein